MTLLSIGAFAHATRLSPKALRLYDEPGLPPPAFVGPDNVSCVVADIVPLAAPAAG